MPQPGPATFVPKQQPLSDCSTTVTSSRRHVTLICSIWPTPTWHQTNTTLTRARWLMIRTRTISRKCPCNQCRQIASTNNTGSTWSQSKTTGETAQSSTAKLFHYLKSLSIESRLALARLGPLRGHYGGYIYVLRGLMTQPILPTIRTRACEAVKPQDISYSGMELHYTARSVYS